VNYSEKIASVLKIYALTKKLSEKIFALLGDRNVSRKNKILFCEYILELEQLKNTIEFYADNLSDDSAESFNYKEIKSGLSACAEIEKEVLDAGFSLASH
jgi:hypothetical protein